MRWHFVAALLPAFASLPALAQSPAGQSAEKSSRIRELSKLQDRKVSLTLADSTVRDALKALFEQADVNRCLLFDNGARGLLSFSMKDVPFEGALVSILHGTRRARYGYSDDSSILSVFPEMPVDRANIRVTLDAQDVDVRYLIKALVGSLHANYTLDQTVSGAVTLSFDYLPFDQALDRIMRACKTPLQIERDESGTMQFKPKKP